MSKLVDFMESATRRVRFQPPAIVTDRMIYQLNNGQPVDGGQDVPKAGSIWQTTATPSQRLDAATVEGIAQERADWLLDAIAVATQDRRYLRGSSEYDEVVGEAILLNGAKAIRVELERALATEPHQHGGKGA